MHREPGSPAFLVACDKGGDQNIFKVHSCRARTTEIATAAAFREKFFTL